MRYPLLEVAAERKVRYPARLGGEEIDAVDVGLVGEPGPQPTGPGGGVQDRARPGSVDDLRYDRLVWFRPGRYARARHRAAATIPEATGSGEGKSRRGEDRRLSERPEDGTPRSGLSACVIARDEADRIGDCLASLAWCDEIVVVDSHSSDRTREIAAAAGARVLERDWPGYAAQKNFATAQAAHDWVLCIDADERVSPPLRAEIEVLRESGFPTAAGFEISRRTFYLGRWIRHGTWFPDWSVRLYDPPPRRLEEPPRSPRARTRRARRPVAPPAPLAAARPLPLVRRSSCAPSTTIRRSSPRGCTPAAGARARPTWCCVRPPGSCASTSGSSAFSTAGADSCSPICTPTTSA